MAELTRHPHYEDDDVVNFETRHEESDVNVRGLVVFVIVFIVFAIVTHLGLWLLFKFYVNISKGVTANAPLSAVAAPPNSNVPDLPRLQPFPTRIVNGETNAPYTNSPETDMLQMAARQNATLNGYSWVDKQRGIVRIPIEEAKRMALSNGTYRQAAAPAVPLAQPEAGGLKAAAPQAATQSTTTSPQPLSHSATQQPNQHP